MSANQRINKELCSSNSSSPAHILRVIEKSSHQFNIINASTAFSRLAKTHLRISTAAGLEEETLRTLLKRCKNLLRSNTNQLEPRHLSSILWAVGKMRLIRVDGLEEETARVLETIANLVLERRRNTVFGAQEISNLFWASAKICGDAKRRDGDSCVDEAIIRMQEPLQRMFASSNFRNEWTTQGISNVCWSLAKITMVRMVWIVDEESDLNKSIANAVEMGTSGPPTKRFNAQEFANIAWAMAKFNEAAQDDNNGREVLVNRMAHDLKNMLISETIKGRFESRHVANTFLAFAKVNQCAEDSNFLFKLKTLTRSVLKNMNAHELSMVMVGVGLINDSNSIDHEDDEDDELAFETCQFFTRSIASYTENIGNENDDDDDNETSKVGLIANVLWALAKLPKLLVKIADKQKMFINNILKGLELSNSIANMNGRQASTILWSLAKIGDVVGYEDTGIKSMFELFSKAHFSNASSSSSSYFKNKTDARSFSMILWAFSFGVPDVATNERAKDIFESAHKDLREKTCIDKFNARDLANVMEAFSKRLHTPEKVLKIIAKRAAEILGTFNAQELLKFLGAFERAGGDIHKYEKLSELLHSKRTIKISFPALGLLGNSEVKLRSATPSNDASKQIDRVDDSCGGFGRQNTGVALWEGSRVLAEWISRISTVSLYEFCSKNTKWAKLGEDGFITPNTDARDKFFGKGRIGVELGAGLGLPSIVASKLGANVIATDGAYLSLSFALSSLVFSFFLFAPVNPSTGLISWPLSFRESVQKS